ncbi:MAG: flagellar hook protein [Methylibium sp. NZG]|nr:MAG: flagellar hook protein [Methylibium sp. NZG]
MGTGALMSIGTRAMFANYAALTAVGNNIANANTPGYSRQQVELATAGSQGGGSGFFGKGVDVATVSRSHNQFLTREVAYTASLASADAARAAQLSQLENIFDTGEAGIGHAAGQFLNAFVDVAAKPQDASARQVALSRADELATRFRAAGQQVDALQSGVSHALGVSTKQVSDLAQQVATINQKIVGSIGAGHEPNDLLDQRDQLVREISQQVQVTTIAADDGSMNLFIGGGQRLVLGGQAAQLVTLADPYDASRMQLGLKDGGVTVVLPDNLVTGGSTAGLLRFQNDDLVDARNLLGQMAASIAGRVNEQQALGLDLRQPAGSGAPIFDTGSAKVMPHGSNAKAGGVDVASMLDVNGARISTVSIAVTTPSELEASDYLLQADPGGSGGYQLTRLSDGLARAVAAGDVVDGFRIDIAAPAPAAGDRFLLQTVGGAAGNLKRVLDDPRGIAAAAPVTATAYTENTGTATVASIRAVSTTLDPNLRAELSFTNATGDYDWVLYDSGNNVAANGTATWQAGRPIALNGFELSLSGVPANGDRFTVEKTAFPATNNGNARALVDLRDAALIGQRSSGGVVTQAGVTVTDAYANALADVGVRVQSAKTSAQMSASASADAQAANAEASGVNLDEEAARLIQFQQSYQAAAKMLQVAQSVFDTLLDITR